MPFDPKLAVRVKQALKDARGVREQPMFGGLCFMVGGHMCCGVERNRLVVRVGPEQYQQALALPHARPMDFTGRPLKGFVYVSAEGCRTDAALRAWVSRARAFIRTLPPKPAKEHKGRVPGIFKCRN